jgi:hypothetical protein
MKIKSINNFAGMLASVMLLLLITVKGFSQTGYNCYIKNITSVDSKTIRFEVWIESTGGSVISLQGLQAGINFNYTALANGGTITGSFIASSADPSLPQQQQSPNWRINPGSHQIQLFAAIAAPKTTATLIPSNGGIKLGTFEMKNTADFTSGITPDFSWSFSAGSSTSTKTAVTCYTTGDQVGTNITISSNHLVIR